MKLFNIIATSVLGAAMMAGAGVALANRQNMKMAKADTTDVTYTMADYDAGVQYAENETHVLDSVLTVVTNQIHFSEQLRMYQNGANSGKVTNNFVRLESKKKISKIILNANCNTKSQTTTFKLSGSNDSGANYTVISSQTTVSGQTYGNLTYNFGTDVTYKTLLINNTGSYQGRIKTFTVTYVNEATVVSGVSIAATDDITSGYMGFKNVQLSADVSYSSGQGEETVTWTSSSVNNTVNSNGVVHFTANEDTTITATSVEDDNYSDSITIHVSGLVSRTFNKETITVDTATFGSETIAATTSDSVKEFEEGNIHFTVDRSSSTSDPGFYVTSPVSFRIYKGSELTISTLDGNGMSFISLRSEAAGNKISPATVSLSTGVFTIDENGDAFIDLSASPASSVTISSDSQFRFDVADFYYYVQTDAEAVEEFIDNFMHMTDYTENLGYCADGVHNYYGLAKAAFNGLNATRRALFMSDATYADAKARLLAWASANGDILNGENTLVTNGANQMFALAKTTNNSILIVIAVASFIFAAATCAFFILRKKRFSK